ncbi:Farnesyl-diphosphate farnesyltransferase, partial [Coemansia sp. RSA 2052]
ESNTNSWISHCRLTRIRITGYKRKRLGERTPTTGFISRAHKANVFFTEILLPLIMAIIMLVSYMFMHSVSNVKEAKENDGQVNSTLIRALIISMAPVVINFAITIAFFFVSFSLGPCCAMCLPQFGKVIAGIVHTIAVVMYVAVFMLLWVLEDWNLTPTIMGLICQVFVERAIFAILQHLLLSREFGEDETNVAWWTGRWYGKGMGGWAFTLTMREWMCKVIECSVFTADVLTGHIILFFLSVFTLIPWVDKWHSAMLFWLRPSRQIRPPIYSLKQRKQRRRSAILYGILFVLVFVIFLAIIIAPQILKPDIKLPDTLLQIAFLYSPSYGWTFKESGPDEKDAMLLVEFDVVINEFMRLPEDYQEVIADITKRMGAGMAKYTQARVNTLEDYNEYCHYVAGLVGHGLSRLFAVSRLEDKAVGEKLEMANSMGLFLQKTNITRDINEDVLDGRCFWPKAIWTKYAESEEDLISKRGRDKGIEALNEMCLNALQHIPDVIEYLNQIHEPSVFKFCAIPQAMAIATISLCYNNSNVLDGNVKIRKGEALKLISQSTTIDSVKRIFYRYLVQLEEKNDPSNPFYGQVHKIVDKAKKDIANTLPGGAPVDFSKEYMLIALFFASVIFFFYSYMSN